MDTNQIQAIREAAKLSYRRLSDKNTTVYAVTHARRENSSENYDSEGVISSFMAILPRQQEAFEGAVKMMERKAQEFDNSDS